MTAVRKDVRDLSQREKDAFVAAVKQLKAQGVYDQFTAKHYQSMSTRWVRSRVRLGPSGSKTVERSQISYAHRGPAFLPWHRAFLAQFEAALQQVDPAVTIPYWDWATDDGAGSIFTADFMGKTGQEDPPNLPKWAVTDGQFAYPGWQVWNPPNQQIAPPALRRELGRSAGLSLPMSYTNMALVMLGNAPYDQGPWYDSWETGPSFRRSLETLLHDAVHVWVGGDMANIQRSPNDPVFYLHHANVDRLWAAWQDRHPTRLYQPGADVEYVDETEAPIDGQTFNSVMPVVGVKPEQVWDHRALGYEYESHQALQPVTIPIYCGWTVPPFGFAKGPASNTVPLIGVPSRADTIVTSLTRWHLRYANSDNHLRSVQAGVVQPQATPTPTTLTFSMNFEDDSNSRSVISEMEAVVAPFG